MPRSLTPTGDKPSFRSRLPDLKPTLFRVVLGVSMTVFALLLQWYLVEEGHMSDFSTWGVVASVAFGALAYWLAQTFITFLVIFCPLIAITALVIAIWGWLSA